MVEAITGEYFDVIQDKLDACKDVKQEGSDSLKQLGVYKVHTGSGQHYILMYKTDKKAKIFGPQKMFREYNFRTEGFDDVPYQERTAATKHPLVQSAEPACGAEREGDKLSQFFSLGKGVTLINAIQWLISKCVEVGQQEGIFQDMQKLVSSTLEKKGLLALISPRVWIPMIFKLLGGVAKRVLSQNIELVATVAWDWVVKWFRSLTPFQKAIAIGVGVGILAGAIAVGLGASTGGVLAAAAAGGVVGGVVTYIVTNNNINSANKSDK
mmetsp:Transcript_24981/g.62910  ORF Transcript_24981/g.62910 Transcript_24981/m.62910 type:complete len:268 (-) Transcript_24981:85-888(-)|eukprot:CAMPEP_0113894164 /NCGR_PEP_ID=MMETSP0780_2-20120614/16538_1 /TAXON_ID=652834 /ORGANISM="Palpitomonas bilix" /LENGTH=267 /DNA_ID=CAMNT_0000884619 /DNA_START=152 /DNA_END=955 /DNA_ORIENTATION=+ /assembly_acc=CAM_ASM_000599